MNANESQTLHLPAGQVLTLANSSNASGIVIRMARLPGGGDAQSITVIAGANLSFGAYAEVERFNIICATGTVVPSMAVPDPALVSYDAEVAALLALKISHSLAVAENDMLIGAPTPFGTFVKKTLAQFKTILGYEASFSSTLLMIAEKTPVNAVAAQGTITMSGIATADQTFVVDAQTFTWKASRTGAGEVTIGADAPAAVTNIVAAINADLATVAAVDGAGNTVVITAATKGVAGNAIVLTESSTNMSVDGAGTLGTTTAGVDGTIGIANETCADGTNLYHCTATNSISDTNWRKVTLSTL